MQGQQEKEKTAQRTVSDRCGNKETPSLLNMEKRSKGEVEKKNAKFTDQKILGGIKKERKKKSHSCARRFFLRF